VGWDGRVKGVERKWSECGFHRATILFLARPTETGEAMMWVEERARVYAS